MAARKWLIAALCCVLGIGVAGLIFRETIANALIDLTGETEPKEQVRALITPLFQTRAETADLTELRYSGYSPYGVNTFFEQEVEEWKLRRSMEMLRAAGVRWIRQQIPWADIEPFRKGGYVDRFGQNTWEKYDRIVRLADEYGLEIVARLDVPPAWSRTDNSNSFAPPDNFDDYGDFVESFVQRYHEQIHFYQIWNEPNTEFEWGNRPIDAREYVRLLQTGYTRIKSVDPKAVVLAASLAPTVGTPDGRNVSDLVYLEQMYEAGAKDYFDIMSVMAYGLWTGPGDHRRGPDLVNFSRLELTREIMVKYGDAAKPVWASEMGWNALPADFGGPATHGQVSEANQARYTVHAYERARNEWPWLGVVFYWHFRPVRENPDQVVYYFRMVDPDFTPRPVYEAYKEMATAPPVVGYGVQPATHWAIETSPGWTTTGDRYGPTADRERVATKEGEWIEFTFYGTGLDLLLTRVPDGGQITVTIDGDPIGLESRRGSVDLADPSTKRLRLPIARGLSDGVHHVRIVVESPGRVIFNGVVVDRVPVPIWGPFLGALLAAGAAVAVSWALRSPATAKPSQRVLAEAPPPASGAHVPVRDQ